MSVAMHVDQQSNHRGQVSGEAMTPQGRLRVEGLEDTDRNFAIGMHLSPFAFFVIGPLALAAPLVLWLIRKDKSAFSDDHGRETVNFLITYSIACVVTIWTIVIPMVLMVLGVINMIRGAVAAGRGEYFRYPMTFRFIN